MKKIALNYIAVSTRLYTRSYGKQPHGKEDYPRKPRQSQKEAYRSSDNSRAVPCILHEQNRRCKNKSQRNNNGYKCKGRQNRRYTESHKRQKNHLRCFIPSAVYHTSAKKSISFDKISPSAEKLTKIYLNHGNSVI